MTKHDDDLARGRLARDEGMAQAETADRDGWDTNVIDQAIEDMNRQRQPWSANDLRRKLPEVRQPLIGARVNAARNRKDMRRVGYVASDLESTHAHPIALWVGTLQPAVMPA